MARKATYDQDEVKNLRMSVIRAAQHICDGKSTKGWSKTKIELILRMSPRVLPVLNAGRNDDEPIFADFLKKINESDSEAKTESQE